jgi:MFS family permease
MTGKQYWKNSPLEFVPSAEQQSYIACMLPFGGVMGSIIASPCTSQIGRKSTLLINALFFIASFLILIFTDNLLTIYIARFLQGIGDGIAMVALPIYVGEISSVECR